MKKINFFKKSTYENPINKIYLIYLLILLPSFTSTAQFVSTDIKKIVAGPFKQIVGDFNGDGNPDQAIACYGADSESDLDKLFNHDLALLLGHGDGTFDSPLYFPVGMIKDLLPIDFNFDGVDDIAFTNESMNLSILFGNLGGSLSLGPTYPIGYEYNCLVKQDLNLDNKQDILLGTPYSNEMMILYNHYNNPGADFSYSNNIITPSSYFVIEVGHFNNDLFPDIILMNYNTVYTLINSGGYNFTNTTSFGPLPDLSPMRIFVGKLNEDNIDDIVIPGREGVIVLNSLMGGGVSISTYTTDSYRDGSGTTDIIDLILWDYNGDGIKDFSVIPVYAGHELTCFKGLGNGSFVEDFYIDLNLNYGFSTSLCNADFNKDGKEDFSLISEGFGPIEDREADEIYTFLNVPCNYKLKSIEVACNTKKICIPLIANKPLTEGVVGIDFTLTYDTSILKPTGSLMIGEGINAGNPSFASYAINTNIPGQLHTSIFTSAEAPFPFYFIGSGEMACINFYIKDNIATGTTFLMKLSEIKEGNLLNKSTSVCSESGIIKIINNNIGRILFWNNTNKPLRYDSLNPQSFIKTEIHLKSGCGINPSKIINPNKKGEFPIVSGYPNISFERDIEGSYNSETAKNIMTWINGADQALAAKIATKNPTFSPNLSQMIAADVNMDGEVSSLDVSLINWRSTLKIKEFPQLWNYAGGAPIPSAGISKDWVFINSADLKNPSLKISSNYPSCDGVGFCRSNVPNTNLNCSQLKVSLDTNNCFMFYNYSAILLGDVNGNWKSADGSILKEDIENQITINLKEAITIGDKTFRIPVYYAASSPLTSLDLTINYEETKLSLSNIVNGEAASLNIGFNNYKDDTFLLSSYSNEDISTSKPVLFIDITTTNTSINSHDFKKIEGYVNGDLASVSINGNTTATLGSNEAFFSISPNPSNGIFNFLTVTGGPELIEMEVYNELGITVKKYLKTELEGENKEINLSNSPSGIYTLKFQTTLENKVVKLVKQ